MSEAGGASREEMSESGGGPEGESIGESSGEVAVGARSFSRGSSSRHKLAGLTSISVLNSSKRTV